MKPYRNGGGYRALRWYPEPLQVGLRTPPADTEAELLEKQQQQQGNMQTSAADRVVETKKLMVQASLRRVMSMRASTDVETKPAGGSSSGGAGAASSSASLSRSGSAVRRGSSSLVAAVTAAASASALEAAAAAVGKAALEASVANKAAFSVPLLRVVQFLRQVGGQYRGDPRPHCARQLLTYCKR